MQYFKQISLFIFLLVVFINPAFAEMDNNANTIEKETTPSFMNINPNGGLWHSIDEKGNVRIKFYFFWSTGCSYCKKAHKYLNNLPEMIPWLDLLSYNVSETNGSNKFEMIAKGLGEKTTSVPAFVVCGKMTTGYANAQITGKYLYNQIAQCHKKLTKEIKKDGTNNETITKAIKEISKDEEAPPVVLPIIGEINPMTLSLPMLTFALAGVDAFNPCAFFVLLFLLSLMVNAKSRSRMLLVGGVFVTFSGLIYFMFMAAWLNLFLIIGQIALVTTIAGAIALTIGVLNIKDFFFFKQGVSLSISDENKTGLFKRMSGLVSADNMPTVLLGTVVLSIAANAYELLCTAGFPMVFTRILTLSELSAFDRYMYLVSYNVIYVIPLAVIVLLFTATLGKRKLSENEGKTLKLLSGPMIEGIGGMLLIFPEMLQNSFVAIGLILSAIAVTFILTCINRFAKKFK